MSITVTSTPNTKVQAPVVTNDGAETPAANDADKPSVKAQGTEQEEQESTDADENESTTDGSEGDEPSKSEDKPKKKSGIQRLKERHAREMAELRRDIDSLSQQVPGRQQVAEEVTPAKVSAKGEPNSDDFETHAAYVKALIKFENDQRDSEREQMGRETHVKTEFQKKLQSYAEKLETFKEAHEDYDDVADDVSDIRMSAAVRDLILDSDNGPELAYQLGKQKDEFKRLCKLPPLAAAREMGKFEAKFLNDKESPQEKVISKTKAPPPLKAVGTGSSGTGKKSIYDPNISQADYESMRREQIKKRNSAWG